VSFSRASCHRALVVGLLSCPLLAAADPSRSTSGDLAAAHRTWLEEVDVLALDEELEAFADLKQDYQRQAFIERFWEVRDPYPETGLNEFLEAWQARREEALERFGGLDGARARTLLVAGPPREILSGVCQETLRPLEIWLYSAETGVPGGFSIVFVVQPGRSRDNYDHWSPGDGLETLASWRQSDVAGGGTILDQLARSCFRGGEVAEALARAADWQALAEKGGLLPAPSPEWVATFMARLTEVPAGSAALSASLSLSFPGRRQSRTVVQGMISIPREEAGKGVAGDQTTFSFLVDGEVLLQGRLFDRFRYRFDLPADDPGTDPLPLAIQRYLRPNEYTLILRVRDLNSQRYFREERTLQVPTVSSQRRPELEAVETTADLEEANQELARGDNSVRIAPPAERLHTDRLRVEAVARGEEIDKVQFVLDGRPVMSKKRPPFSIELDLGPAPLLHTVEAVALDADGNELSRDRIPINAGPHRFSVRLLAPLPGKQYDHSLRAHAEVDIPRGERLERLDFYLNETRLASLYQPPWVQPVLLPGNERITYVRAVAYLDDGNSTEDLVFINLPEGMAELTISFVELYTSVVDRRGQPVDGLVEENFVVLEDGIEQRLARFERVQDLSIHAGILLDSSTSMEGEIEQAVEGALRFFEGVIRPRDRAAVIVFNDQPTLAVPFTNDREVLAGGLANVVADGETALYDSLVYALYYFAGVKGKKALILLSDGEDSSSRHSFDDALGFARRSGVAIYAIAINLGPKDLIVRRQLQRLAQETGGEFFSITRAAELAVIYSTIEEELRAQYLLAYQSPQESSEEFRTVEVRVTQPDLEAKTIPGYYP
jgi:Ca-activated chloride channel family protein